MTKTILNKALIICISIISLLMFLVPYATVFNPADGLAEEEYWQDSYILSDEISIVVYVPFILFWVLHLFLEKGGFRTVVKFILLALSFYYFIVAASNLVMLMQDFEPGIGIFITMLQFPALLWYLINGYQLSKLPEENKTTGS